MKEPFPAQYKYVLPAAAASVALIWAGIVAFNIPREPISDVQISELWKNRQVYMGKRVRVAGTLKVFLQGKPEEHYAVESADLFRIGVEGVRPQKLRAYLNTRVRAEGRMRFSDKQGGYLSKAKIFALR